MSTGSLALHRRAGMRRRGTGTRGGRATLARRLTARPELLGVMALAALLDLWNLSLNGYANTYYAAAVRSMAGSWHDFLYGAMDPAGLMTVDKPPLALWVQALSVRLFGYHPLSILVPEALIGALVLALTPVTVAISRHNNPDELLALCCVSAVWCALRAIERDSLRWLIAAAVAAGLGFETKMAAALLIVPAIALVSRHADVAGIGGFSGRESSVGTAWLAGEVAAGKLRWLLADSQGGGGLPGDTRSGSRSAFAAASQVCRRVTLPGASGTTLLDCAGRSADLRALATAS